MWLKSLLLLLLLLPLWFKLLSECGCEDQLASDAGAHTFRGRISRYMYDHVILFVFEEGLCLGKWNTTVV
jgi:hypothetical protein